MSGKLEIIQDRINNMPAVSANTVKILNLVAKEDYNIKELADLIALDVSLSTRCLQVVNSASYVLRTEVTSIERAVSYLGKQAILGLIIESGFSNVFNAPLEGYNAGEGELWEHSLRTAIASRIIALKTKQADIADLAYTAGLLHNMGKVVLTDFLKDSTNQVEGIIADGVEKDFSVIEKEFFETNHAEVGHMMAAKWGIPKIIQSVIMFHHNPVKAPDEHKHLCYIVHLGDNIAMLSGGSSSWDALLYSVDSNARKYLDIEDEVMEDMMFDVELEVISAKEKIFEKKNSV